MKPETGERHHRRCRTSLTLVSLLAICAPGAWAGSPEEQPSGNPTGAKPARPGPDFPSLESYYPTEARRLHEEGTATVSYCVDASGKLTAPPTIDTSSLNATLDAAALELATAGSGHYLPALKDGLAVSGCARFRVAFKLREAPPLLADSARFPTIAARVAKLNEEYMSRMRDAFGKLGPNARPVLVPTYPDTASAIRQYARAAESALDEGTAITADFFEDMDYLERSPDVPTEERSAFSAVWPEQRAALSARITAVLEASRDLVRLTDELADYTALKNPAPSLPGGTSPAPAIAQDDPQVAAMRQRAQIALERLKFATEALEGASTAR